MLYKHPKSLGVSHMMDQASRVESIVTFHRISRKKVYHIVMDNFVNLYKYLKYNFIVPYVEEESFILLVLIYSGIANYLLLLILFKRILHSLHIPEVRFPMKFQSRYATM